ncbi:Mu transposase C-terminal domain-containing protein [Arthrobacter sp. I2-34]|uniref:Mu transposase C-terminal domain-containing protein n=1 Tax=Arthrobacter hankyongi TaxID=2904801 RepID=A0ABS9L673_9MICC|nr:Mu transposase C-terminal domain-containing protein [Arthrobacter hankyongi]MCG2622164.1 Mu transposase C-terminal domain-containing protein [Arthrobacter hankyongi]
MAENPLRAVGIGDVVELRGLTYRLEGLDGDVAMLAIPGRNPVAIKVGALLADDSFRVLSSGTGTRPRGGRTGLPGFLPAPVRERIGRLEDHISEVLDGIPLSAAVGTRPRPEYDPARRTLRQRELAKHDELARAGEQMSLRTLQRLRREYEARGAEALIDRRLLRRRPVAGQVDERYVEALRRILEKNTLRSTGSLDRLRHEAAMAVEAEHGAGEVALPSRATFHRLVARMAEGRHATGSARTRQTLDQQPDGPFGAVYPVRPGELMQIDSTPLDIAVELGDGITGRVELTALVDVATRSICAAVLRPTTRAVDAALLLARCMTPEPMRPGWAEAVSMASSALPYRSMLSVDARLQNAAAKPVIIPETIVCDHGKAYLSDAFRNACRTLGVSLQPAHPDTPTDKPVIERTLGSVGTLFAQYVTGYLGSSAERRGKNADRQAVFSLIELQDLLKEWIVTAWQNRPHEGLRDPLTPSRVFTPNEKYASLLAVTGYVAVPLGGDDYIELLPALTRAINSYGIRIRHRVYDGPGLNPYRGQKSGITALKDLWEVHYDPYDVTRVWVRNHHDGGWITVFWRQLQAAPQPFGEAIWERGRQIVAERGTTGPSEQAITEAVENLLERASPVPGKPGKKPRDKRAAARQEAIPAPAWPRPPEEPAPGDGGTGPGSCIDAGEDDYEDPAKIIPLKVYDAQEEAKKWW